VSLLHAFRTLIPLPPLTHSAYMAHFTKSLVEKTLPPKSSQLFLPDDEVTGFALRVTSNGARRLRVGRTHKTAACVAIRWAGSQNSASSKLARKRSSMKQYSCLTSLEQKWAAQLR